MPDNYIEYLYSKPLELEEMIKENPIVYIPFGALEWHSEHNILGVDSIKATEICKRSIEKTGGVLFPCVNYGAFSTMKFPFTFHNPAKPLKKMTKRMAKELHNMGFRIIIFMTGHYPGGQIKQVRKAARWISRRYNDCFALGIPEQALVTDLNYVGDHAASWETSMMMAINLDYVDLVRTEKGLNYPERVARHGIMGKDPSIHASKEQGEMILKEIVERLTDAILKVKETQSIQPFEDIYKAYKEGMKSALRNLKKIFEIHGIEGKREGLAFGKWMVINRKKYKPDYRYKKKKSNHFHYISGF